MTTTITIQGKPVVAYQCPCGMKLAPPTEQNIRAHYQRHKERAEYWKENSTVENRHRRQGFARAAGW